MNFNEVNELVPYKVGPLHTETATPYENIGLVYPGRHQKETSPVGGDFRVVVTSEAKGWANHPFTHVDLFSDLEEKSRNDELLALSLVGLYRNVVDHRDTDVFTYEPITIVLDTMGGLETLIFLQAVQCLAVAEHRRYFQHEAKFGGRYLPLRFACGIVEKKWTAADAANLVRRGRPGVEILERANGMPSITKSLFEGMTDD